MYTVTHYLKQHLMIVFFIYGLAFFVLGLAILFQNRKNSEFKISRTLWYLAAFGLLHGLNEWMDMFLLLGSSYWTSTGVAVIEIVRVIIGKTSYIFLLFFGLKTLMIYTKGGTGVFRFIFYVCISLVLFLVTAGFIKGFSSIWFLHCDIIMRYSLAFQFQKSAPEIRDLHSRTISRSFTGTAFFFAVYAVLSGLVVPKAPFFPASVLNYSLFNDIIGIPVQIFRSFCALGMSFYITRILKIFEIEVSSKLVSAVILEKEILKISNRERQHIGQDIHDGLCQHLAGMAFLWKAIEQKILSNKAVGEKEMVQIEELINDALIQTRSLARGLIPVELEENGLASALDELAENVEKLYGVSCRLTFDRMLVFRDNEIATHLFRIAQEAINNAIKNGKATHVTLEVFSRESDIVLSISDDGVGMPETIDTKKGMGLRIMKYRAGTIGAALDIISGRQGGVQVVCTMKRTVGDT